MPWEQVFTNGRFLQATYFRDVIHNHEWEDTPFFVLSAAELGIDLQGRRDRPDRVALLGIKNVVEDAVMEGDAQVPEDGDGNFIGIEFEQ